MAIFSKTQPSRFVSLPVEPTRELRFELDANWDGRWPIQPTLVAGARIKPVVFVPEAIAANVDKFGLKAEFEALGATYVKTPHVHVVREKTTRDARHAVDLPLEESLRIFAEETRTSDLAKVAFAAAIAREADAGVRE